MRVFKYFVIFTLFFVMNVVSVSADESNQFFIEDMKTEDTEEFVNTIKINEKIVESNTINNLNSVTVDNNDGTNTVYIFNEDIRYIDDNGNTIEKDLSIINSRDKESINQGYFFSVKSNDIKTEFPLNFKDRGLLVGNIEIIPHDSNAALTFINDEGVIYEDVFDRVDILCEPKYQGTSIYTSTEDVAALNNVKFNLSDCSDYSITEDNGKIIIDNNCDIYEISGSDIIDDNGHVIGETYFSLEDSSTIRMQYSLESESTDIGAISTNANIRVNKNYIVDTTLVESPEYYDVGYNYIGTHSQYGISRTLVKFDLSALRDIDYDKVLSACFVTNVVDVNESNPIAEVYMVAEEWDESTYGLDFCPEVYYRYKLFEINIRKFYFGSDDIKSFYITSAVQAWLQGMENNGIMIKSKNDEGTAELASSYNSLNTCYLTVTYSNSSSDSITKGVVENEKYYIINKNSKKALTVTSSDENYTLKQSSLVLSDLYKWQLVYNSTENGVDYFIIRNVGSVTFLDASFENDEYSVYSNYYYPSDNQKWQIIRNWDGSYKLIPKVSQGLKSLAVLNSSTENGGLINLETINVDFNKNDDWTLIPVEKGDATIYGVCDTCSSFDSTEDIDMTKSLLSKNGFSCLNMHVCVEDDENVKELMALQDYKLRYDDMASRGIEQLFNSNIFYSFTHGLESRLQFFEPNEYNHESRIGVFSTTESDDEVTDINVYGVSEYDGNLNKLNMCILTSCSAGANNGDESLVGTIYEEGAHCIISQTEYIGEYTALEWSADFSLALSIMDVESAIKYADRVNYTYHGSNNENINSKLILGDTSIGYNYDIYIEQEETSVVEEQKVIEINGSYISLNPINVDVPSYAKSKNLKLYRDSNNNLYGFSKSTDNLLLYYYNHKNNSIGNQAVWHLNAYSCASGFLTDIGFDLRNYSFTSSNDYSNEFIITYTTDSSNCISKATLYVEEDDNGEAYVTFYLAEE